MSSVLVWSVRMVVVARKRRSIVSEGFDTLDLKEANRCSSHSRQRSCTRAPQLLSLMLWTAAAVCADPDGEITATGKPA
jgi:hypothetical protein